MTFIKKSLLCLLVFGNVSVYADETKNRFQDIMDAIDKLCKAPTKEKSSYYSVEAKGKLKVRVKLIGLADGEADFKKEEWEGYQRVLQKDQSDDNKQYRECSKTLTIPFLEKFSVTEKEDEKKNNNDKVTPNITQTSGDDGINISGGNNITINK